MISKKMLMGALGALLLGATPVAVGQAGAQETVPSWCAAPRSQAIDATAVPSVLPAVAGCDLTGRLIRSGNDVVGVPPRGMGVALTRFAVDPSEHGGLTVHTRGDGSVRIASGDAAHDDADADADGHDHEHQTAGGPFDAPQPDPCASSMATRYTRAGYKAYSTITWGYNPTNEPATVAGSAQAAVARAALNMADGHNDCAMTTIPATSFEAFTGATTTNSSCGTFNTSNVVAWKSLPMDRLAHACTWYYEDRSPWRWASTDIEYNTNYKWTTGGIPLNLDVPVSSSAQADVAAADAGDPDDLYCELVEPAFDVEAVGTHEWGHAFGLGHVSDSGSTSSQTMSAGIGPCDAEERSLGRGDLNGMIAIYGGF